MDACDGGVEWEEGIRRVLLHEMREGRERLRKGGVRVSSYHMRLVGFMSLIFWAKTTPVTGRKHGPVAKRKQGER